MAARHSTRARRAILDGEADLTSASRAWRFNPPGQPTGHIVRVVRVLSGWTCPGESEPPYTRTPGQDGQGSRRDPVLSGLSGLGTAVDRCPVRPVGGNHAAGSTSHTRVRSLLLHTPIRPAFWAAVIARVNAFLRESCFCSRVPASVTWVR
jgi:hypothetical protein